MDRIFKLPTEAVEFRLQQRQGGSEAEPTTIFLHGLGGDLYSWDDVWNQLPADFPALRYDLRGFGLSAAKNNTSFSHSDDLLAIMDSLNIDTANIVGVSMGGAVALNFALNSPQRVNTLMLISPALVAWEWSAYWQQLWHQITELARSGNMAKARQLWWLHPLFATTRKSPAAEKLQQSIERYSGNVWIADYQRPELPDVERLYQLDVATLLLSGGKDLDDFRLMAELLSASASNLKRVDFPDNGHLLNLEIPEACCREILGFLNA